MNNPLQKNLLSFIWHFLKPYKQVVIAYVLLGVFSGLWSPLNNLLIKHMINTLSAEAILNISSLIYPATLLVLNFVVFDNFTWRSMGYLSYKYQPIIKNNIISNTFSLVLGSSHQFFQDNFSGRISNQITILADSIERILHNIAQNFIRGASMLFISFISMYYVNPKFFWTLAIWCTAFSSYSIYTSKRLVNLSDMHTASEAIISGQLVDNITNTNNIRMFSRAIYETLRLDKFLLISKEKFQAKQMFALKLYLVQGMMIASMLGFMLYFLVAPFQIANATL